MKIIYRANDGKEFDNKYDCQTHERELKEQELLNSGIIFLDSYREIIDAPIYDSDTIHHMYFPTAESMKILNKIYQNEYDDIVEKLNKNEETKPNIWYHWNDCEECYESDEYKIKQLQDHIEEYNDILKKINQEVK